MNAWNLIKAVFDWPVSSQQAARRNALVALTALTQLRIERADLDAYFEAAVPQSRSLNSQ